MAANCFLRICISENFPTKRAYSLHHPKIVEQDFTGSPTIIDNRYKLVIIGSKELFDLQEDPVETNNLFKEKPKSQPSLKFSFAIGNSRF